MKAFLPIALAIGVAACAADQPPRVEVDPSYCPDVPAIPVNQQGLVLPPRTFSGVSSDWESVFAYNLEQSLSVPSRLAGRPADTARDLAQLELLANSFQRNLRFQTLPAISVVQMRQGSVALRDTMGVSPEVSSAQVAGALFATECLLRAGDPAAARSALARVAQAPDALDLIAPPGGQAPPRIPGATVVAASVAAKAIRSQGDPGGRTFFRVSRLF
jgi:hypothetical protein